LKKQFISRCEEAEGTSECLKRGVQKIIERLSPLSTLAPEIKKIEKS
jgi:hypothetical protein